jgi:hypothetical protein
MKRLNARRLGVPTFFTQYTNNILSSQVHTRLPVEEEDDNWDESMALE